MIAMLHFATLLLFSEALFENVSRVWQYRPSVLFRCRNSRKLSFLTAIESFWYKLLDNFVAGLIKSFETLNFSDRAFVELLTEKSFFSASCSSCIRTEKSFFGCSHFFIIEVQTEVSNSTRIQCIPKWFLGRRTKCNGFIRSLCSSTECSSTEGIGLLGFERTASFHFDEIAPTLAISKIEFLHNVNAVFEFSKNVVSKLYQIETLPVYFNIKVCWLNYPKSDRL